MIQWLIHKELNETSTKEHLHRKGGKKEKKRDTCTQEKIKHDRQRPKIVYTFAHRIEKP